ncbi:MAG: hypothetical protein ACI4SF_00710 [Oscillospiraceae bacterium]
MNDLYTKVEKLFLSETKLGDIITSMEKEGYNREDIIIEIKRVSKKYVKNKSVYE